MRNPPINWAEGMFLRPHHFQASDRYWHELMARSQQLDSGYSYGLQSIRISEEAILNGQLAITDCRARMKDGTILAFDGGQECRIDLQEAGESLSANTAKNLTEESASDGNAAGYDILRVYLAVPQLTLGIPNVGTVDDLGKSRYFHITRTIEDEVTGGNSQELDHRELNASLLLSSDDLTGYEVIPICQLRRQAENGQFQIDQNYIPPCLAVDAWLPLALGFLRKIYDILGARATTLSQQIINRNISFSSREPGDLEKMLLLNTINEAQGTLSCLAFGLGVHPFLAYRALCELVGRMAIFGPEKTVSEIPQYDHDDLARIFNWAMKQIIALLDAQDSDSYVQRYFIGSGKGLQVTLEAKWFDPGWTWYVGVHPVNISEEACLSLLNRGTIDWKLGSSDRVDWLYTNLAPGIELIPLPQVPRSLPTEGKWIYFQITRDNEEWRHVQTTKNLAIRLNQKLIRNADELIGQKRLKATVSNKLVGLEFAVFAVAGDH